MNENIENERRTKNKLPLPLEALARLTRVRQRKINKAWIRRGDGPFQVQTLPSPFTLFVISLVMCARGPNNSPTVWNFFFSPYHRR